MRKASFDPETLTLEETKRFVRDCMADRGELDVLVAVFLASELAANAIAHSRVTFDVSVELSAQGVWVCVEDLSGVMPVPLADRVSDLGRVEARFVVLEALADRWGFELTVGGARVWFEIDGPPEGGG